MTPETAVTLRDHFTATLQGEHKTFLGVVGAMPGDRLGYRPEERLMSFGRLALHIVSAGKFFHDLIRDGKTPDPGDRGAQPEVPDTTAALVESCASTLDEALTGYRGFDGATLAREVDFHGMGACPAVNYVEWHLLHLVHHRGQLTTYLRVAGEKVPSVYGPTADVTFEDMHQG